MQKLLLSFRLPFKIQTFVETKLETCKAFLREFPFTSQSLSFCRQVPEKRASVKWHANRSREDAS